MSVQRGEVERIAELARLRFRPDDVERLTDELNRILEYMEVLRRLAERPMGPPVTEGLGVPPTRTPGQGEPDALAVGPDAFAPRWLEGFFVVPPPPGVHASEDDA